MEERVGSGQTFAGLSRRRCLAGQPFRVESRRTGQTRPMPIPYRYDLTYKTNFLTLKDLNRRILNSQDKRH